MVEDTLAPLIVLGIAIELQKPWLPEEPGKGLLIEGLC